MYNTQKHQNQTRTRSNKIKLNEITKRLAKTEKKKRRNKMSQLSKRNKGATFGGLKNRDLEKMQMGDRKFRFFYLFVGFDCDSEESLFRFCLSPSCFVLVFMFLVLIN